MAAGPTRGAGRSARATARSLAARPAVPSKPLCLLAAARVRTACCHAECRGRPRLAGLHSLLNVCVIPSGEGPHVQRRDRESVGHAREVARSGQQLLRGSSAPAAAVAGQQGEAHGLQVRQARRCLSAPCHGPSHPGRPAPPARASPGRRRTLARSACARALSPGSYASLTVAGVLVCSRLCIAVTAPCVCPVRCRCTCATHMPLGTAPLPRSQSV